MPRTLPKCVFSVEASSRASWRSRQQNDRRIFFPISSLLLSFLLCAVCSVLMPFSASLAALLRTASAAEQQLCASTNSTPSSTSYTISNNDALVGIKCLYANFTVTLGSTLGNTSVVIDGGMVSAGNMNGILFKGFTAVSQSSAYLGDRGPLRIVVRNVTFLDGAILKFDQLFPNATTIDVQGNTFINTLGLANVGGVFIDSLRWVACIVVDFNSGNGFDIVYSTGYSLIMANNTATVNSKAGLPVCVVCVLHQSASLTRNLTFAGASIFSIRETTMVNSDAASAFVVYMGILGGVSSSLTIEGNASMILSGNAVVNSGAANAYVVYVKVASDSAFSSLRLSGGALMRLSGNSVVSSIVRTNALVAIVNVYSDAWNSSLIMESNASMVIDGNTVVNSSTENAYIVYVNVVAVSASSSFTIRDRASMSLSENALMGSPVTSDVYVVFLEFCACPMTIEGNASMTASSNAVVNSSASIVLVLYVSVDACGTSPSSSLTITDNASMIVSENAVVNSSVASIVYVVYVRVKSSKTYTLSAFLIIEANAAMRIEHNKILLNPLSKWPTDSLTVFRLLIDNAGQPQHAPCL